MAIKYIIYEDVAKDVVVALKMLIGKIDEEMEYWGSGEGSMLDLERQHVTELLHRYETGLCLYKEKEGRGKMVDKGVVEEEQRKYEERTWEDGLRHLEGE